MNHPACPTCTERIWRYDGPVWTCRHGHHTTLNEVVPQSIEETDPRPAWHLPAATITGSVLLSLIVDLLVK